MHEAKAVHLVQPSCDIAQEGQDLSDVLWHVAKHVDVLGHVVHVRAQGATGVEGHEHVHFHLGKPNQTRVSQSLLALLLSCGGGHRPDQDAHVLHHMGCQVLVPPAQLGAGEGKPCLNGTMYHLLLPVALMECHGLDCHELPIHLDLSDIPLHARTQDGKGFQEGKLGVNSFCAGRRVMQGSMESLHAAHSHGHGIIRRLHAC
mmetsp:Transcript_12560/g.22213  ORF Transcript_12560/g.22213 Transcript_12560/m.22213 type:complete len:203 (+) Transcript_12560:477-1085(+)